MPGCCLQLSRSGLAPVRTGIQEVLRQAGVVAHDVAWRYRCSIREVCPDEKLGGGEGQGLINVQFALLGQLHGRRIGKSLAIEQAP